MKVATLALVFATWFHVPSCARLESVHVLAQVFAVEGEATVARPGNTEPRALVIGQRLSAGDVIHSAPGAKIGVSLLPGLRVVLLGGTEVTIGELTIRKSPEPIENPITARRAEVNLAGGALCGSVSDLGGEMNAVLAVTTPAGSYELEPGAVLFLRAEAAVTHAVCAEEQVTFHRAGDTSAATLEAGKALNSRSTIGGPAAPVNVEAGSPEAEEIATAFLAEQQAIQFERTITNKIPAIRYENINKR